MKTIKVFLVGSFAYTPFMGFHQLDLEYFVSNGIQIINEISAADVLISQNRKRLRPYFTKYWNTKKYLIWTFEPRFDTFGKAVRNEFLGFIKLHVMNVYTGDVFVNMISYQVETINKKLETVNTSFKFKNRTLVALMSYYKGLKTENVPFRGKDVDLIKVRTAIALYGYNHNRIHIYGKGWPQGISKEDSRDGDWTVSKAGILNDYHFNLCFENTAAPRYVTEKIWDSIANYCLPIYYGTGTEIYDLFPKDSFIDYSLMQSPQELFKTIQSMSDAEYVNRLNKCITVYNVVSSQSDEEKAALRIMSLDSIIRKITNM
jgi:hypothetical protein